MFVETTLETHIHPIDTIKKAWGPGRRLVKGADGSEEIAAVLQYSDMFDYRQELTYIFIRIGLESGIIMRDKRGGFTVDYPLT